MKTSLVNVRAGGRCDVWIGRPSPFGNPYALGPDGDRGEVLRKYRYDFGFRVKADPAFRAAVEALRGKVLG